MRVGGIGLICSARLPQRDLLLRRPTYLEVVELLAAEHLSVLSDVQGALRDNLEHRTEARNTISRDRHIGLERAIVTLGEGERPSIPKFAQVIKSVARTW